MAQLVRRIGIAVASSLSLVAALVVPAAASTHVALAAPTVTGTETDLGIAIPGVPGTVRSEDSDQGELPDGRYLAYFASDGGPGVAARFLAMMLDGSLEAEVAIPHGTNVESLVYSPTSRSVFVAANGSGTSYLYEWDGAALHSLTTIAGHEVMRLAVAPDGDVYIGTYAPSNGRLFRWSRGALTDLGQPFPGESYVRSLAVDASYVWASNDLVGAAKLVRMARDGGARTSITTPASFRAERSAFSMTRTGNFLFLRTVNGNRLYAYDVTAGTFRQFDDQVQRDRTVPEVANKVEYLSGVSQFAVSPLLEGRYVYLQRANAGVMRIDTTNGLKAIRVDKYHPSDNLVIMNGASVAGAQSWAWLTDVAGRPGNSLVATTADGRIVVNTPGQAAQLTLTMPAQDSPSRIDTLGSDSAGRIYSGGFDLPAGIGMHSSSTGTSAVLAGPQIEGFGRFGDAIVMGGYTGVAEKSGPLYMYDGSGQPEFKRYLGNSQERPVAIQQVGPQVAIGSVPIKNTLGGALSIWNPATNALTVKRNIVPDHSIISLSVHGTLIVGGSSNIGGTGTTPAPTSAQVFTYNPATGAVKTFTPPRFATATHSFVAAITADPASPGHFWAISTGYLIQLRVADDGSITLTKNLGAIPNTTSPTGKGLGIVFVGGTMFATIDGGISAVDQVTGERTVVAAATSTGPVVGLSSDGQGRLYYARGSHLYRFTPAGTTAPPSDLGPMDRSIPVIYCDLFGYGPGSPLKATSSVVLVDPPQGTAPDTGLGWAEQRSLSSDDAASSLHRAGPARPVAPGPWGTSAAPPRPPSVVRHGQTPDELTVRARRLYADVLRRSGSVGAARGWVAALVHRSRPTTVVLLLLTASDQDPA